MAALTADPDYTKEDPNVNAQGVDEADSDVQQVAGRNYDPVRDQRDMKRLGKRQELKVRHLYHQPTARPSSSTDSSTNSAASASSVSSDMSSSWA